MPRRTMLAVALAALAAAGPAAGSSPAAFIAPNRGPPPGG